jgi:hypothetical protein
MQDMLLCHYSADIIFALSGHAELGPLRKAPRAVTLNFGSQQVLVTSAAISFQRAFYNAAASILRFMNAAYRRLSSSHYAISDNY